MQLEMEMVVDVDNGTINKYYLPPSISAASSILRDLHAIRLLTATCTYGCTPWCLLSQYERTTSEQRTNSEKFCFVNESQSIIFQTNSLDNSGAYRLAKQEHKDRTHVVTFIQISNIYAFF
jgi:hypothetical protein